MITSPRLDRFVALLIALFLTVPLRVGTVAETQTRDSQPASVDTARAQLSKALALEKETATKEAALAADEALERYNAAVAASSPQPPADEVGIAISSSPTLFAESEPNDTAGTADSIALLLTAQRYLIATGAINPGGDLDFYTFSAAAGSRIWIETDTGGPQNPGANNRDTVIDLLAADGTTVIESDDDDGTGNGGDGTIETGLASMIAGQTLVAGGTYYIRVRAFGGTSIINPYRLLVVLTTAASTPEVEGNNTAALANLSVPVSGSFGLRSGAINVGGDVDYYSVAATAGSVVYFNTDADPERDGTGTDLVVEFRDPFDTILLSVDSSITGSLANPAAEGSNFTVQFDGIYFIKVRHFSASGTGTYHLMTAVSVPTEEEPNDGFATADRLDFTGAKRCAIIAGAINSGGDVDFYSFEAPAGSRVWIATDTGGVQNPGANSRDTIVDLLSTDGVTGIETDDDDGTGNGGDGTIETGLASIIGGRTLVTGGTYFIRVQAFNVVTGVINPYKLFVVVTNTAATGEVEANNTFATANTLVTTGSPIGLRSGSIGLAGDADYYSVVASAGTVVYFNVDADPERDGPGTDLVVEFRSPSDVLLLSVDSSITGSLANPAAEGANFMVTTAGTYFIKVRHFSGTGTGTYHLMAIAATGHGFPAFTDSPLTIGVSLIRALHFNELRSRVDALRLRFGLTPFVYSHPSLVPGMVVDADDLAELRTALTQAYLAAGRTIAFFTNPTLFPQSTIIREAHISELRAAVIELESS